VEAPKAPRPHHFRNEGDDDEEKTIHDEGVSASPVFKVRRVCAERLWNY
jgi:hypothetical protein